MTSPRPTTAGPFHWGIDNRWRGAVFRSYSSLNWRRTGMALKSMSVAKLMELKGKVEAAIADKVAERRNELEMELSELARHDSSTKRGKADGRLGPRGPVAPKYRNPKDTSQTWAGRGLQPLWIREAIKSGKKLDSFLIK
jgi:DNA-binding protein H-NS